MIMLTMLMLRKERMDKIFEAKKQVGRPAGTFETKQTAISENAE